MKTTLDKQKVIADYLEIRHLEKVAKLHHCSRERVRQIITKAGLKNLGRMAKAALKVVKPIKKHYKTCTACHKYLVKKGRCTPGAFTGKCPRCRAKERYHGDPTYRARYEIAQKKSRIKLAGSVSAYRRKYFLKNKEKLRTYGREYQREHKEKMAAYNRAWRARKVKTGPVSRIVAGVVNWFANQ